MQQEMLNIQIKTSRCPYCHDEVQKRTRPAICHDCHAVYHFDCMSLVGECVVCHWQPENQKTQESRALEPPSRVVSINELHNKFRDQTGKQGKSAESFVKVAADSVVRTEFRRLYSEIEEAYEGTMFRNWWAIFIPHFYIPIFWPFLLMAYYGLKKKLLTKVNQITRYLEEYDCSEFCRQSDREFVFEVRQWCESW